MTKHPPKTSASAGRPGPMRLVHPDTNTLRLRRLGIDTYQEPVIYMSSECPVCLSEGWTAQARVQVSRGETSITATLNVVTGSLLGPDEVSLSDVAWSMLAAADGDEVTLSHPTPLDSLSYVRAKAYGRRLGESKIRAIVADVAAGRYSAIELAAFLTGCAGGRMDVDETVALTRAMVEVGERLEWDRSPVMDKHSVGGLPGNRTTMVVVPIVTALGPMMPKTSSRAITSPAGTADAMETVAPVALNVSMIRRVVEREGGCVVWGGAVRLSPADDAFIRVARPLDLDTEDQLVASVLSKKVAAGATHVVIDIPVGPTAKIRSREAAHSISRRLLAVGAAVGLGVRVVEGDGSQPVGRGIGPALEARDVLAVLQNEAGAPGDLRARALVLAGHVLEVAGVVVPGAGLAAAVGALTSGAAWRKFEGICEAQGGMREPPRARFTHTVEAASEGRVVVIDNRRLARVAKLAGAPRAAAAGVELHVPLGTDVRSGQPLFTLHAESPGALAYSLAYAEANGDILSLEPPQ